MNTLPLGDYFLLNHELVHASSLTSILPSGGIRIYEVIRVINGVSLFLEDHLLRLNHSLMLAGKAMPLPLPELKNRLAGLLVINKINEGNYRLELIFKEDQACLAAWFVHHSYPTVQQYSEGVALALLNAMRTNPNAKIVQTELRGKIDAILEDKTVYEVLLVNNEQQITEGSRSNFFLVREHALYTAPVKEILEGITRKILLRLCSKLNIPVYEQAIPLKTLPSFDAAFLTGTSPKILPVQCIGKLRFNPANPLLLKVMHLYDEAILSYLSSPH